MEDGLKKLEALLQNHITEENKKAESTDAKIDDLARKFDVLMEKLLPNLAGILGSAPMEIHNYNSRVEFPYFDGAVGADPCSWLRKCERYFHYNHLSMPEQKLEEAVLHLKGRAEAWYFSYQLSKGNVRWPELCEEICRRFQDADNKGLKEDIRHTVKMLNPYNLSQDVEKARHQEKVIETWNKKGKTPWGRGSAYENHQQTNTRTPILGTKGAGPANYSAPGNKGFDNRRNNGLCWKCGDKYFHGHVCKQKQINAMAAAEDQAIMETVEEGETGEEGNSDNQIKEEVMDEAISLNSLSDLGSTHSFLDIETPEKIGCKITESALMRITVANGNYLTSRHTCHKFKQAIQGVEFEGSVRLVRLGGNEEVEDQEQVPAVIQQVLKQFPDVVEEPTSLPPKRNHDHYIPLKPNTTPVSIRPYSTSSQKERWELEILY
ncbi:hypothetical protein A4A49_40265 [Nicotiana attenuata]|uniref:Retrotransposon gag domain-containing protein n=1 Tax=Nicotiana attenuata TaxID=49451 RepID=A0A1J6ITQ6_NICAT|nr:hypothetical protein A4A49_40265 [Nicotiana attenuata]